METLKTVTERAILDARAIAGVGRMVTTDASHLPCGRGRLASIVAKHMRPGDDRLSVEDLAKRLAPLIEAALLDD
jgi:hypothetical protein